MGTQSEIRNKPLKPAMVLTHRELIRKPQFKLGLSGDDVIEGHTTRDELDDSPIVRKLRKNEKNKTDS